MPSRNRYREQARLAPAAERAPQASTFKPSATVRWILTSQDAIDLASLLLGDALPWPIAVVSIASTATEPYIDARALKDEVGDLADVYVMPTNDVSRTFSAAMPDMTQVYGGAGRVYPTDGSWRTDPYASPLRFAFSGADGPRAATAMASDVMAFAMARQALEPQAPACATLATGTVKGIFDSRAMVALDDGTWTAVWPELTVPGVSAGQLLARDQRVTGLLDIEARRLDLRGSLKPATRALGGYRAGDMVLARVSGVSDNQAVLALFPGQLVTVGREAISDNPADRMGDLLTAGEVVVAWVETAGPAWSLRLDVVDDDDEPLLAPALIDGGPPWLTLAPPELPDPEPLVPAEPNPQPEGQVGPAPVAAPIEPVPVVPAEPAVTTPAAAAPHLAELHELQRYVRDLERGTDTLRREVADLRTKLRSSGALRRKAVRQSKGQAQAEQTAAQVFADPVEQFRHEVYLEWAGRIGAADKEVWPLREYQLSEDFLTSLDAVEGIERAKVVAVVVEVVTGLDRELPSRDLHALRTAASGGSKQVVREDGATCWRVALQRETAGARRLHYWLLGNAIELSRVVLHDDMEP